MSPAIIELATEIIKLIRLLIEDQPPERRRQEWERWYRAWEPFWKMCGLEVKDLPK